MQGIIDAFFEEDDGYVLLDYKTDYVKDGEEEDFINKYKIQINLYKDTLNKILGEEVKEAYLYSFYLEKEYGFKIVDHALKFYGVCKECKKKNGK